jgi:mannose-6-phosphate isomerase
MVWGGRGLADVIGKPLPTGEPYGESWEVSDHPLHRSRAAAGHTLRELMEQRPEALLGARAKSHTQFPWLVKFLDACDWLSVQVHPDEQSVRELWPGEGSKTEAWFVLKVKPGSRIYAGLRPGVDKTRLGTALEAGTVTECLHAFEPRPGDCVFLRAGTVHAVGGGVLMAEVQQTSDATFRLFDWNRRDAQGKLRQLHVEQSLACIDWSRGPVDPIHVAGFTQPADAVVGTERQHLVKCEYFELEYVQGREPMSIGGSGRLQMFVALRGRGQWKIAGGVEPVTAGHAWVLPAAMPATVCEPDGLLGGLVCTLP